MELAVLDKITAGGSFLHRLDGRVKTGLFLSAIVVAVILHHWYLVASLWLATLVLFHTMHLPWRILILRLSIPFSVAWLVCLDLLFTNGSHPLLAIYLGPISLIAYREGLQLGILIVLRIMAAVTLGSLLSFSTSMIEILETMRLYKMPGLIVDLAAMMYRYTFILEETARNMRRSQLSRMGDSVTWLQQARDTGKVAGHLLAKSLDRSTKIYKAMLARGYDENSTGTAFFNSPVPKAERQVGFLITALLVVSVILDAIV